MSKKIIMPIILAFCLFLIPFNVSAVSCFTSEEILLINNIAINNNESSSVLLGIFDKICDRVREDALETELNQLRNEIMNMTEDRLNNYTDYITNKTQLIDALSAIANIINTTSRIDDYLDEMDRNFVTKMEEFNQRVVEIIKDTEEELEGGYLTKADFDEIRKNMTMESQMMVNEIDRFSIDNRLTSLENALIAQPDYTVPAFIVVIAIVAFVLWKMGYIKTKKEKPHVERLSSGSYRSSDPHFNPELRDFKESLDKDEDFKKAKAEMKKKVLDEAKKLRNGIKEIRSKKHD